MKKADLVEKLEELGLDTEGTVKELQERLAEAPEKPVVKAEPKARAKGRERELPARKAYRMGSKTPKSKRV